MAMRFNFPLKALITALLLCNVAMAETPVEAVHEIKDPYYGNALFEFYQEHYFTTLTGLMVK
jgi:hypothetical protein